MTDTAQKDVSFEPDLVDLTADIVSAYVGNNTVVASDLPELIASVHAAISSAVKGVQDPKAEEPVPAVPIKKSVSGDYIICLEDGKRFKSLKRHLRTHFDMTPEDYRAKWNLPPDYPMVAPNYAAARSELAKKMGLGQQATRKSKSARK